MRHYDKINVFIGALSLVVLIVSAVVAFREYKNHVAEVRVSRAFDFEAAFRSPELFTARNKLDRVWSTASSDANDTEAYYRFVLKTTTDLNIEPDIKRVLELLEDIAKCVEQDLCDRSTTNYFVRDYGTNFLKQHYPYLCEVLPGLFAKLQDYYFDAVGSVCPSHHLSPSKPG